MHPLFRQVPPILFFSIMQTFFLSCAALIAAIYPAGPAPKITISNRFASLITCLSKDVSEGEEDSFFSLFICNSLNPKRFFNINY